MIARLKNCIRALADYGLALFDTSILYAYELSSNFQVSKLINAFFLFIIAHVISDATI